MYAYGGQRLTLGVFLDYSPHPLLRQGLPLSLELTDLDLASLGWPASSRDGSSCFYLASAGITGTATVTWLLKGSWGFTKTLMSVQQKFYR